MTFSSKLLPCASAIVMVTWLPITWAAACATDSAMTGLILPGMIDEPGCTSGRAISPNPARGPDPSQRTSLAIFNMLTATVFRTPLASVTAFSVLCAWKWFSVSRMGRPVDDARRAQTISGELNVTPDARADGRSTKRDLAKFIDRVAQAASLQRSIWPACPKNSWPSRMGVASCRCVRPVLITSQKVADLSASACCRRSKCRHEFYSDAVGGGNLYRRRDDIVGRLAAVDVVVGMNHSGADLAAENLRRPIGNDLVRVHIRGRS